MNCSKKWTHLKRLSHELDDGIIPSTNSNFCPLILVIICIKVWARNSGVPPTFGCWIGFVVHSLSYLLWLNTTAKINDTFQRILASFGKAVSRTPQTA